MLNYVIALTWGGRLQGGPNGSNECNTGSSFSISIHVQTKNKTNTNNRAGPGGRPKQEQKNTTAELAHKAAPNKKQKRQGPQSWPTGPPQTKKKKHNSHYSPWWIPYGAVGAWGRFWWGWPKRVNTKGEPTNKPRTNQLMFWIVGNPTSKLTLGNSFIIHSL